MSIDQDENDLLKNEDVVIIMSLIMNRLSILATQWNR